MNDKELREIRKRFRSDRSNITNIRCCIINSEKKVVSSFNQSMAVCTEEETENLLSIMKKALSGSLGTNLLSLNFSTSQVSNSEEHRLLSTLRSSSLKDEEAVNSFMEKVIESVNIKGGFAVLLAHDTYDVFSYSRSGDKDIDSSQMFSYVICAVCPVKQTSSGMYFREEDNLLRRLSTTAVLSSPEIGFMFPAFDNRAANIYSTLYYTRDVSDVHPDFIKNIFNVDLPMSASEQKENFGSCLKDTLEGECDFEVLKAVHDQVSEMIEEHKNSKDDDPLSLSRDSLKNMLQFCGIDQEKVDSFGEKFDEQFGKNAEIAPKSIVNVNRFELQTPDVSIKVNPERKDLVSTQTLNGVKYIMVRAEGGVEVNGIDIDI